MDMSVMQAFVLGVVQGIGEFLPISSSAHLIIVRFLFNFKELEPAFETAFDVALHFGTLIAVLFVFWKDWLALFKGAFLGITKKEKTFEGRMFWYLVAATIPGAVIGMIFESVIEDLVRSNMIIISVCLAIMGILIYIGDKWAEKKYKNPVEYKDLTFKQTFIIGLSQALAVIPGFSRSGTTILAARLMGISREAAAKFTFLLSTPIIFGAAIIKVKDLLIGGVTMPILVGIVTAAVVGVFSIKFLLRYIKKNDFAVFAYYRVIIAIIVLVKVFFFA
ncbi:undecaprenyl-diphosphatase [Clostridium sp. CAG:921]|nr:undecaprenyl-diphosphatase [Clostridium sp. CAG:921]